MQENRVQSPVQEDPLEKGISTYSIVLPREPCGQRSLAGYSPLGCKESDVTERLTLSLFHIDVIVKFMPYLKTRKRGILRICMLK